MWRVEKACPGVERLVHFCLGPSQRTLRLNACLAVFAVVVVTVVAVVAGATGGGYLVCGLEEAVG